jgi:DNA polymerase-3 subunit alpha
MDIPYFEVHCHSEHSLLDGLNTPEELVVQAKEIGIAGLSITDHGTLSSHREMLKAGIKHDYPVVLGVEAYFSGTNDRFDRRKKEARKDGESVYNHIILLAKNDKGLQNIQRIQSLAWTESYYNKPIIDFELLSEYGDDIIISSACVSGVFAKALQNNDFEKAEAHAMMFKDRFGGDFYAEVQEHNDDISAGLNDKIFSLADKLGIKPIITSDTHFAREEDRWIEDALLILNTGVKKDAGASLTKANKMDFMDRYNYLYPDRTMTFEHIDVYLQNGQTLHDKMLARGVERTDIYSNTMEILGKIEIG